MSNHATRRRHERDRRRRPSVVLADNTALPLKFKGEHRWVAMVAFGGNRGHATDVIAGGDIHQIFAFGVVHSMSIGCWDCEQNWNDCHTTECSADPAESQPPGEPL